MFPWMELTIIPSSGAQPEPMGTYTPAPLKEEALFNLIIICVYLPT